jgi:hypothetical protein
VLNLQQLQQTFNNPKLLTDGTLTANANRKHGVIAKRAFVKMA